MFRKIKRLFVEEISPEIEGSSTSNTELTDKGSSQNSSSEFSKGYVPNMSGDKTASDVDNSRFLDILFNAIEENNIEGFDYLEYKHTMKSLDQVGLDEKTKFKSALAMGEALGSNIGKILSSAEFYLGIIEKEKNKFEQAVRNQMTKLNEEKAKRPAALIDKIESQKKQIEQLESEIKALEAQLQSVRSELSEAETKIYLTQKQFSSAYNQIYNQILSDISKIKSYINT